MLTHRCLRGVGAALLAVTSTYCVVAIAQEGTSSGEVRRVDAAAGKITIKAGAITELQLPAMILVYRISPDLLKGIKPGDKVTFTARREGDNYVVTKISK